jgi:hydroxyacyl-ACP dehydratase HTD2-like protein with hotdog domain
MGLSSGDNDHEAHARADSMAPENAERLAAVLDAPRPFRPGDHLPLLWHWAYFNEIVAHSALGPDGHPARADALAQRLPRRMAASGSVEQLGPLVVGRPAVRRSHLADLEEKQGRSGPLAFAHWRHIVEQDGRAVLDERQTIVYREGPGVYREGPGVSSEGPGPSGGGRVAGAEVPVVPGNTHGTVRRSMVFDTARLFGFSAVTGNAHRIHYDWPYATGTEGYPGLVVHGPLLAVLLALEAAGDLGELKRAEFRSQAPVFVNDSVDVLGQASAPGTFSGHVRRADGTIAMSLVAEASSDG